MTDVVQAMNYNRSRIQYQNSTIMETRNKAKLHTAKSSCI